MINVEEFFSHSAHCLCNIIQGLFKTFKTFAAQSIQKQLDVSKSAISNSNLQVWLKEKKKKKKTKTGHIWELFRQLTKSEMPAVKKERKPDIFGNCSDS